VRWVSLLVLTACANPSHPVPEYGEEESAEETTIWGTPAEGGQASQAPDPQPARGNARVQRPFLWVVRAGRIPSVLFGTIHVGVSLEEALSPTRRRDLRNARTIVLELDPSQVRPDDLLAAARMPDGESADSLYPAMVWHDLANELNTMMPASALRQLRPWYAMVVLTQMRVQSMHEGLASEAMDLALARFARRHAMNLGALETPQAQLDAFNAIPNAQVAESVREMIEDPEAHEAELRGLMRRYREGDENAMTRLIFDPDELARMPQLYQALFYQRNDAWMPRVKQEIDEGGAFIAVGLGHLLGPEGLVARLRSEGYDVERVSTW